MVPPGCRTLGSLHTSQGGLEDQQVTLLASCLTGVCCWLSNFQGSLGEWWEGAPPRVCPGCPAFLLSSRGLLLQPQESQGWKVWLEISSVVHGQTWGICLVVDPLGWVVWGEGQTGLDINSQRVNIWGQVPQEAPQLPNLTSLSHQPAHPSPCPSGSPSRLHPPVRPAPGTRGPLPSPNHIWFSLGVSQASV